MSMRWDPLLTAALARELDRRLRGARVRALLLDHEARRVVLHLRESTVVAELHPTAGWISLLPAAEPPEEARPLASTIVEVNALPDDSVLALGLRRVRGRDEGVELLLEWVGNRWNAAVVGHRSRVVRHVLVPRKGGRRPLVVGGPYHAPSTRGRAGPNRLRDVGAWEAILEEAGGDPEERRRALLRAVAYTSSLNVERFLGEDGFHAWRRWLDPSEWGAYLLDTARGPQPYPLPLPGTAPQVTEDLVHAMALARRSQVPRPAESLLLPPGLVERVEARVQRARGRLRGLQRELEGARDPEPLRSLGDLILARYGEIPAGRDRITLEGFDGTRVEVEMDPALSPHENAGRYYDEAARIERARKELPRRIEQAREEVESWERELEELLAGRGDPVRLRARLGPDRGQAPKTAHPDGVPSLPYRRFRSSGGLEIRVGRGARRNDDLTFRHSSPGDIWLHARQAPGAHVILRWGRDENPPRRDLLEAATLAALHSEARHSGSVPVDWTRRKYVRKPRKAAPGAVVPDRVETVFVEPDEDLARRLKDAE
jgi:predicted ribosome quality control (RQC) complex YloA/Tae2 family protein